MTVKSGILVAPNNFEELAKAITELCDNAELRSHMGLAAIRKFKEKFTAEIAVKNYMNLYESKSERENHESSNFSWWLWHSHSRCCR